MTDPSVETLPAELVADRFFLRPITIDGQELRLLADTGGQLLLLASTVERLGVATEEVVVDGQQLVVTGTPRFRPERGIAPPSSDHDPRAPQIRGRFLVLPDEDVPLSGVNGILGHPWFGGRVWTFDYPRGRLLWHASGADVEADSDHTVRVGFPADEAGRRLTHFPSIEATIDGERFAFLFDTGATVRLTRAALADLGDSGPAERGTCFVVASVFDRWRERHGDWWAIEGADAGRHPMLEVPSMEIAGHEVGPVWFTRRPDQDFHDYMSRWMDRRVDGALGGSFLRYFTVTIDYPAARAAFRI